MKVGDTILIVPRYECKAFYAKILDILDTDYFPYIVCPIINYDYSNDLKHKMEELSFAKDEVFAITDTEYNNIQKVLIFK